MNIFNIVFSFFFFYWISKLFFIFIWKWMYDVLGSIEL